MSRENKILKVDETHGWSFRVSHYNQFMNYSGKNKILEAMKIAAQNPETWKEFNVITLQMAKQKRIYHLSVYYLKKILCRIKQESPLEETYDDMMETLTQFDDDWKLVGQVYNDYNELMKVLIEGLTPNQQEENNSFNYLKVVADKVVREKETLYEKLFILKTFLDKCNNESLEKQIAVSALMALNQNINTTIGYKRKCS